MSAHNCQHCGEACDATAELCAPCELNIVKLALKDVQAERTEALAEVVRLRAERDEAQARARRAEADVNGAWNAHGMVFDELNRAHAALKDAQAERDEAREQLAKAYDVIAWMKALPGVSHLMAVSLLRGGR